MTRNILKDQLSRFSYKPGWKFSVKDRSSNCVYIHLRARVPDAYGKKKWEYIEFNKVLYLPSASMDLLHGTLRALIDDAEAHEFAEWFKYGGRRLYDPHR